MQMQVNREIKVGGGSRARTELQFGLFSSLWLDVTRQALLVSSVGADKTCSERDELWFFRAGLNTKIKYIDKSQHQAQLHSNSIQQYQYIGKSSKNEHRTRAIICASFGNFIMVIMIDFNTSSAVRDFSTELLARKKRWAGTSTMFKLIFDCRPLPIFNPSIGIWSCSRNRSENENPTARLGPKTVKQPRHYSIRILHRLELVCFAPNFSNQIFKPPPRRHGESKVKREKGCAALNVLAMLIRSERAKQKLFLLRSSIDIKKIYIFCCFSASLVWCLRWWLRNVCFEKANESFRGKGESLLFKIASCDNKMPHSLPCDLL